MPVDSGSGPGAHSSEVRCQADQIPFRGYVRQTAQTELPEADHAFDPSEDWFGNNCSPAVSGFDFGSGELVLHPRAYGPPVAESMKPPDIIGMPDDHKDRGLHFICFNTQIGRQFEFIQHTWLNSPKFDGLYEDDDPIVGDRGDGHGMPGGTKAVASE